MSVPLLKLVNALQPPAGLKKPERLAFFGLFLMAAMIWWQEVAGHQPGLSFYSLLCVAFTIALTNLAGVWSNFQHPMVRALGVLSPLMAALVWGFMSAAYSGEDPASLLVFMLLSVLLLLAIMPFGSFNAFLFSLPLLLANNRLVMLGPWDEALHINLLVCLSFFVFWYGSVRQSSSAGSGKTERFASESLMREIERLRIIIEEDRVSQRDLEQKLKQREQDLEEEIRERTKALRDANTQLSQQIALRKTISDALVKSQTRLTQAIDASRLGLIDWDLTNGQFYQSAFHDYFGEREQESSQVIQTLKNIIHAEDYPLVRDTLNKALKGELEDYQLRYRVADGETWLWIEECGRVVDKTTPGTASRILGTRRNIQSEMMRDEQVRLAKSVFDHTSEGVFVLDAEGRYLSVNPAYCAITGLRAEDVAGKAFIALSESPQKHKVFPQILANVRERGSWQGELLEKRKHGDYFPQWTQINRIIDERGVLRYYAGLISDLSDRKATDEKLDYLLNYDALTRLANRVQFRNELHRALLRYKDQRVPFALVSLDIDRFKQFNDSFGHEGADNLLREVADRLSRHVQKVDLLARVGGNEFACVVACSPTFDVNAFAERLYAAVTSRPYCLESHELMLSCSVGIARVPEHAEDIEHLVQYAALAVQKAKFMGGGQIQIFDEALKSFSRQRLQIEQDLRKALGNAELEVFYQPKLDLKSKHITSFEALIRWRHPERGLVSPDEFVNVAEESGLISDLGAYVLETACRQTREWQEMGLGRLQVSVNLSARQLRDAGLGAVIEAALRDTAIDPACVELELTESAIMEDMQGATTVLQSLREKGLKISIDDFGTGYSSLSYLRQLPVDTLKIDRSFVDQIEHSKDQQAIARAIIVLGNSLNLQIVAEGVENDSQLARLEAYGCDLVQGYHVSRPLDGEAMEGLLRKQRGLHTETVTVE